MKAEKQSRKQYDESFKRDAVALVTEQGHQVTDAARRLGISPNLIYRWKLEFEQEATGSCYPPMSAPSLPACAGRIASC